MRQRIKNIDNHKAILHLAIPNIISHITVPLLSSVDTALVGHLDNVSYLAAVALGSLFFNSLYWMLYFLRMTTTGLTAQAYGENNPAKIIAILIKATIIALIMGILLIVCQKPLSFAFFYLVKSSGEVKNLALSYFTIRIWAAPAALALTVIQGWFLGMQNAKYPLFLSVVVNVLNIILNVICVNVLHLNSDGVAIGTVIAQYLGLGLAIILFVKKYTNYWQSRDWAIVKNLENIKRFFSISFDLFIRTTCMVIVFIFFNFEAAAMGDAVLAANNVLFQLWMILAYSVDGFAIAAESLVGKHKGQKDIEGLKTTVTNVFLWAVCLGLVYTTVYQIFGDTIIKMFTDQQPVILLCQTYLHWIVISCLICAVTFVWDGIYIGSTASRTMRDSVIIATFCIFFPLYFVTNVWFGLGNNGLWFCFTIFILVRGLTLSMAAPKDVLKL